MHIHPIEVILTSSGALSLSLSLSNLNKVRSFLSLSLFDSVSINLLLALELLLLLFESIRTKNLYWLVELKHEVPGGGRSIYSRWPTTCISTLTITKKHRARNICCYSLVLRRRRDCVCIGSHRLILYHDKIRVDNLKFSGGFYGHI